MMCGCVLYSLYTDLYMIDVAGSKQKAVGLKGIHYQIKLAPLIPHVVSQQLSTVIFFFVILYKYIFVEINHVCDAHNPGHCFYIS